MGFWDDQEKAIRMQRKRRDTSKFGISRAANEDYPGRLYIPKGAAKAGDRIRYIKTPEGLAFRISDKGEYRVYVQNGGTDILLCMLPPLMNRYAAKNATSIEVENFNGGYLIPFSQFE